MNTRNKCIAALIAFVLVVGAVFAAIPYGRVASSADESKDKQATLEQKVKDAKNQAAEAKANIEKVKKGIESQEKEKEYIDSKITAIQAEIDATKELIEEYNVKIDEKTAEIEEQQKSIDKKFEQVMDRLRFVYEEGTASYLELILSAEDLPDFLSNVDRVGSMIDFDKSLMDELSVELKNLQNEKTVLEDTQQRNKTLEEDLVKRSAELEEELKAAEQYIIQLRADQEKYAADYDKAKAAEKEANAALEKMLAERQRTQNAQYWGGEFIWPVSRNYRTISSGYGWRVLWGRSDFHLGIDIPGSYGSDIYASNGGTVVVATYHYSYGNYVVIDHGGGYSTLYGHNSRLLVHVGDKVNQGDVIAKMGSTGSSSGNHCHFEVRKNGKTQNPLNYVRRP